MPPRLAIVVLNWNGARETARCLAALAAAGEADWELTVLDNGSRPPEADRLRPLLPANARLLETPENLGFAGGVNRCLRAIRERRGGDAPYYVLLNNDAEVTPGLLGRLIAPLERDPAIGIVGPSVHARPGDPRPLGAGWIRWRTGATPYASADGTRAFQECDVVHGCCFLFRGELLSRVGWLDESYFAYYEETDFCVRARRAGYRVGIVPDAVVYHEGSVSADRVSGLREHLMLRNRMLFVRRHGSRAQALSTVLHVLLVYAPRRLLRALLHRQPEVVPALWRGFWAGVRGRAGRPEGV